MTAAEYVSVACLFAKVLNVVLFYQINVFYAFVYIMVCLCKYYLIFDGYVSGRLVKTYRIKNTALLSSVYEYWPETME